MGNITQEIERLENQTNNANSIIWALFLIGGISSIPLLIGFVAPESIILLKFVDGQIIASLIYYGGICSIGSALILIPTSYYAISQEAKALSERKRIALLLNPMPISRARDYIMSQAKQTMKSIEFNSTKEVDAPKPQRKGRKKNTQKSL